MFLNIITPCSRPQNLLAIEQSINIPRNSYRWMVVFDSDTLPEASLIPKSCETYTHQLPGSVAGHAQRNYAIDIIEDGFVYTNDDDTIIHPDLWNNIQHIKDNDFISFSQLHKNGHLRLVGNNIVVGQIDSHNFIVHRNLIGDSRWKHEFWDADGHFAHECYNKAKTPLFINKPLSVYNYLR